MSQNPAQAPDRYLVLCASLRSDSLNLRLARLAAEVLTGAGAEVDFATMERIDAPSYSADAENSAGFPPGALEFRRCLEAADAFLIVSPEYNFSIPGVLKNAIDWASRFRPQPFNEHMGMLMSASPSMAGGNRGLWALRVPLEHLGARLYPDMFSLAKAHEAFGEDGRLKNGQLQTWFEDSIANFMSLVEANKHYPCIKKAWIEFLGEQPDPEVMRVEE
jgi:NAD(P)H-dependent FMN reductase